MGTDTFVSKMSRLKRFEGGTGVTGREGAKDVPKPPEEVRRSGVCGNLHCCWRGVKFGTGLFCIFMADVSTTETYSKDFGTCLLPGQLLLPEHPFFPSTIMVKKGYDVPCPGSWIATYLKDQARNPFPTTQTGGTWRNLHHFQKFLMWHWDKSKCESWIIFSHPAFHSNFPSTWTAAWWPKMGCAVLPWSDSNLMG